MKHGHYKKPVEGLKFIDVYRVLQLFGVTDQALGHAIKKLLVAGGRGVKAIDQDVQEAIDTLERWQEMQRETLPCVAVRNPAPTRPAWPTDESYRWMAQDQIGTWNVYAREPKQVGDAWHVAPWVHTRTLANNMPNSNWRDTLIERGADE